jgi:hypothetical protein
MKKLASADRPALADSHRQPGFYHRLVSTADADAVAAVGFVAVLENA